MKRHKIDEDVNPDCCKVVIRCCLIAISICLVWALLYMPLKISSHMQIPASLSFMVTQRDLNQYILPNNSTNLLTPDSSANSSLFLVIVVCSAVPNFQSRRAVRETWASDSFNNIRIFFLVGTSANETLNDAILKEDEAHRDIIMENFLDSYNNLTVKSVMLLKWIRESGIDTKYVMKTDDDMFINVPNLVNLLKSKGHTQMLLGCLIQGAVPVKDWKSKWFVPDVIFPERTYPPYLSGTGYVMSMDLVPVLYETALSTPFFYLEDVFITGVCARRAGIKPENNEGFKFYKRKNDTCSFRHLITAHKMSPKELRSMWTSIHNPSIKCKS